MEISEIDVNQMDCSFLKTYIYALSQVENSFSSVVPNTDIVTEGYEKAKSDVRMAIAELTNKANSLMEQKVCTIDLHPES